MIVEKVDESIAKQIEQWPVRSNRASELGHECLRYLVLNRTRWQEKSLHDIRLQRIFNLGNEFEDIVMKELRQAGFRINEQQRGLSMPEQEITGSIDGSIIIDGQAYPLEVKSSSDYAFNSINTVEDIKNHKYPYMRRYISQLTLYLLMKNQEKGVLLFKNKTTGQLKEIWLTLDYELGEQLLKKAESVNKHVKEGTLPDPIEYDEMMCGDCAYRHICLPDMIGKEVEIDNTELSSLLDRLEALKESKKEYDGIDAQVKKLVEGRDKILAGSWFITGKWVDKKSFVMPESHYWQKKIIRAV